MLCCVCKKEEEEEERVDEEKDDEEPDEDFLCAIGLLGAHSFTWLKVIPSCRQRKSHLSTRSFAFG